MKLLELKAIVAKGRCTSRSRLIADADEDMIDKMPSVIALPGAAPERVGRSRIRKAANAFTTRRVRLSDARTLVHGRQPSAGDLVLAEIISIGHHTRLETPTGRRRQLYVGDEVILTFGARYASDQFDAVIPIDLQPCDLVAAGGVAGRVVRRHSRTRQPTRLKPLGLLGDHDGRVLNLKRYALDLPAQAGRLPVVIAVVGTSMNAGKTRVASSLVHGLAKAGLRVGAAKVTGTGSGGDLWSMLDAGAEQVLDFTDMGHASTHLVDETQVLAAAQGLLDHLAAADPDIALVEIADGLLQPETSMLLSQREFSDRLSGIIFAAGDSMGAAAGIKWLLDRNLPVLGFSGLITASPLATSEAQEATGVASFSTDELAHPEMAPKICLGLDAARLVARPRRCV